MWDDEPARAKPRRAPARQPSPAAEAAAEDQQILFAHRSEVDETIYRQAVDVVVGEERCSVAMLQRKLQVSFSEATAIIERMHDEGVVGPQLPSGRREILATRGGRQKTESTEA